MCVCMCVCVCVRVCYHNPPLYQPSRIYTADSTVETRVMNLGLLFSKTRFGKEPNGSKNRPEYFCPVRCRVLDYYEP